MFRCVPQPWFLQRGCGFLFVRRNDRTVFLWLCVFNFRYPLMLCGLWGACLLGSAGACAQAITHEFESARPLPAQGVPEIPAALDPAETGQNPAVLAGQDYLPQSSDAMAQQIEHAIRARQWSQLETLLPDYAAHPQADPFLVLYARGTLLRQHKQYADAIAAFGALLRAQPQLRFVRLDLAIMQVEDKQFADAMANFAVLLDDPETPAPLKPLVQGYTTRLQAVYAPAFSIGASYARNDNVNQVSSARTIDLFGLTFVKNADSLPKVGHGISWRVGARKQVPLRGRHGLDLNLTYHGILYYDQHDYDERTLRFTPAYRHQSYHQWFKLGPVLEKNWLGGEPYGTRAGMQAEWGRRVSERNHLISTLARTNKRYRSPGLYRYEGTLYSTGVTWLHQFNPQTTLWLGANHQRDVLNDDRESFTNLSLHAGGTLRLQNGLAVQANVQMGRRRFDAPHALFARVRSDREHYASVSLWHHSVSFLGITPKLVYNHRSIRSNIPALYSRTSRGFMIETADLTF